MTSVSASSRYPPFGISTGVPQSSPVVAQRDRAAAPRFVLPVQPQDEPAVGQFADGRTAIILRGGPARSRPSSAPVVGGDGPTAEAVPGRDPPARGEFFAQGEERAEEAARAELDDRWIPVVVGTVVNEKRRAPGPSLVPGITAADPPAGGPTVVRERDVAVSGVKNGQQTTVGQPADVREGFVSARVAANVDEIGRGQGEPRAPVTPRAGGRRGEEHGQSQGPGPAQGPSR
jgi:hypothetical protein